jgi:NADH dehydrogenase FAD-containing subunit
MVRVVVVGGSHAGLAAARTMMEYAATLYNASTPSGGPVVPLSSRLSLSVTVVEPRTHEFFTPKIQSVLLGGPTSKVIGETLNVDFGAGKVTLLRGLADKIDRAAGKVHVSLADEGGASGGSVTLSYDRLLLATGSTHPSKPDPTSFPDVLAHVEASIVSRARELANSARVVIIGGGRAGLDLALGLSRSPAHAHIDVHLVHPGPHLLRPSSYTGDGSGLIEKLAAKVKGAQEAETISLHLEQRVTAVDEAPDGRSSVRLTSGLLIEDVDTVVWATGASLSSHLYDGLPRDEVSGRLPVDASLRLLAGPSLASGPADDGRIFVLGDACNCNGRMRAKWARTQGEWLGRALVDEALGKGLGTYPEYGED